MVESNQLKFGQRESVTQTKNPHGFLREGLWKDYPLDVLVVAENTFIDPHSPKGSFVRFAEGASNPIPIPIERTNLAVAEAIRKIDMDFVAALETNRDHVETIPMDTRGDKIPCPTTDKGDSEKGEEVGDFTRMVNPSFVVEVAVEEFGDGVHNENENSPNTEVVKRFFPDFSKFRR